MQNKDALLHLISAKCRPARGLRAAFAGCVVVFAPLLAAGCGSTAAAPVFDSGYLRAQIAIVDADDATWVPNLPDDFDKTGAEPTQPPGGSPASRPQQPKVEPPVVFYYKPSFRCPACEHAEADFPLMSDFKFIKAKPDAWEKKHATGYPYFRWQVDGKWDGEYAGWPGPAAFRDAVKNWKPSVKAVPKAPLIYGKRPSEWDWPGDLRKHLTQPPHNYPRSQVDSMTDEEVIQAHDAWHDRYGVNERFVLKAVCPV